MNTFTSNSDASYDVYVLVQDTELFASEIYHLRSVVDALQKELKKRNYIVVVYALLYCFVVPVMTSVNAPHECTTD